MPPITDINGLEVREGDVVRFIDNHTNMAIFDNWVARVWLDDELGLITQSPLSFDAHRNLSECRFEIIWPLIGRKL